MATILGMVNKIWEITSSHIDDILGDKMVMKAKRMRSYFRNFALTVKLSKSLEGKVVLELKLRKNRLKKINLSDVEWGPTDMCDELSRSCFWGVEI